MHDNLDPRSRETSRALSSPQESRVLVVDDDPAVQRYLELMLKRKGYSATAARDGNQALGLLAQQNFFLVLLDIYMPVKGGFETLVELRKRYPQVKIIAMSGGSLFDPTCSLEIARSLGAHEILSKPFRAGQLFDAMAKLA